MCPKSPPTSSQGSPRYPKHPLSTRNNQNKVQCCTDYFGRPLQRKSLYHGALFSVLLVLIYDRPPPILIQRKHFVHNAVSMAPCVLLMSSWFSTHARTVARVVFTGQSWSGLVHIPPQPPSFRFGPWDILHSTLCRYIMHLIFTYNYNTV